jgi:hypothetical protein
MLTLRYDLNFQQLPQSFPNPSRTFSVMAQLKALFPLFNKGTEENRVDYFASTIWQHEEKNTLSSFTNMITSLKLQPPINKVNAVSFVK